MNPFILGLLELISPCGLFVLLFSIGFLFLTAIRKNIIKNAVLLIVDLLIILSIFYILVSPESFFQLRLVESIGEALILILGIFGVVYFFNYKKRIFVELDKYVLSFPVVIIFSIILSSILLPCSASSMNSINPLGNYSTLLYILGFISPLVIILPIASFFGLKNNKNINRIRYLKLVGGLILIISVMFSQLGLFKIIFHILLSV